MGAKGAVEILYRGSTPEEMKARTQEYTLRFANPMIAAQRGFVDDIIDPTDTRRILCRDLQVLRHKQMNPDPFPRKHSNIPL